MLTMNENELDYHFIIRKGVYIWPWEYNIIEKLIICVKLILNQRFVKGEK